MFQRLAAMLAAGTIAPLQTLAYSLHDLPTALRTLAHARHSGKVVVQLPGAAPDKARVGWQAPGGSWAVAGGLGALGGLAGGWLAGHGAHEVALLGRSGRHAGASTCECVYGQFDARQLKRTAWSNHALPASRNNCWED